MFCAKFNAQLTILETFELHVHVFLTSDVVDTRLKNNTKMIVCRLLVRVCSFCVGRPNVSKIATV